MQQYTSSEIVEFVTGWLTDGPHSFSLDDIESVLHNSSAMLRDPHDGIDAMVQRRIDQYVDWIEIEFKRTDEEFNYVLEYKIFFSNEEYLLWRTSVKDGIDRLHIIDIKVL
mgnify:CR=1 FL=1|tara:strand:+ start:739 stop:1071 length:333 start_codon:yes stop_codon:yes gene_type:complete